MKTRVVFTVGDCDAEDIKSAECLGSQFYPDANIKIKNISELDCFDGIEDFNSLVFLAHGSDTTFGGMKAKKFTKLMNERFPQKKKALIEHIYLVGCDIGLRRDDSSMAQDIADKLDPEFKNLQVHAVAQPENKQGDDGLVLLVNVLNKLGKKVGSINLSEGKELGYISATLISKYDYERYEPTAKKYKNNTFLKSDHEDLLAYKNIQWDNQITEYTNPVVLLNNPQNTYTPKNRVVLKSSIGKLEPVSANIIPETEKKEKKSSHRALDTLKKNGSRVINRKKKDKKNKKEKAPKRNLDQERIDQARERYSYKTEDSVSLLSSSINGDKSETSKDSTNLITTVLHAGSKILPHKKSSKKDKQNSSNKKEDVSVDNNSKADPIFNASAVIIEPLAEEAIIRAAINDEIINYNRKIEEYAGCCYAFFSPTLETYQQKRAALERMRATKNTEDFVTAARTYKNDWRVMYSSIFSTSRITGNLVDRAAALGNVNPQPGSEGKNTNLKK